MRIEIAVCHIAAVRHAVSDQLIQGGQVCTILVVTTGFQKVNSQVVGNIIPDNFYALAILKDRKMVRIVFEGKILGTGRTGKQEGPKKNIDFSHINSDDDLF